MKFCKYHRELISSYYSLMAKNSNGDLKFLNANGILDEKPAMLYSSRRHLIETCKEMIEKYHAIVVMVNKFYEVKAME